MASFNGVADAGNVKKSDIVNNLTSGGTTVPLSAEMGKVLNNSFAVSSYRYENASYAAVYKYGRICFITCTGGNWYTTAAGQNLRQGSATNPAWSVPANCAPINDVEIQDVNTGKRIKVLTTRDVIAATQLNGEATRFSGCWVTAE